MIDLHGSLGCFWLPKTAEVQKLHPLGFKVTHFCWHVSTIPPPEKHLHIPLKIDNWVRWMNIFFLDDQNFRGHIHHFNFFGGVLLGHVSPCFSKPWAISQDTSPDLPPLWWNSSTYHPPLRRYPPGSCSAFLELLRHWKPKGMQQRNIII